MLESFKSSTTNGTLDMLSMMMGVEGELIEQTSKDVPVFVSGIVSFRSETHSGLVSLRFSRETAATLVGLMLGMEPDEVDDETMFDGVGEMTNIVSGQLKVDVSSLFDGFDISIPSIINGLGHKINVFHGSENHESLINTEYGIIRVRIELCKDQK
ncbi:MAG: chemotaxis protein CheX [Deltaproteobacteria bacterium]|nr:chemotaxis protein CheX [Deltaproteobacteria bacterium]